MYRQRVLIAARVWAAILAILAVLAAGWPTSAAGSDSPQSPYEAYVGKVKDYLKDKIDWAELLEEAEAYQEFLEAPDLERYFDAAREAYPYGDDAAKLLERWNIYFYPRVATVTVADRPLPAGCSKLVGRGAYDWERSKPGGCFDGGWDAWGSVNRLSFFAGVDPVYGA